VAMFDIVRQRLTASDFQFTGQTDQHGAWVVDLDRTVSSLGQTATDQQPVVVLGTAFSCVQLLDHLQAKELCLTLPEGSRLLETGGYKGRVRALPKAQLYALLERQLGIRRAWIVSEYGMSELSSQAYDRQAGQPDQTRVFRFPPWARAQVVSPEHGREVPDGATGLIRLFDLANVYSVLAIDTEDLAVRRGTGFELIGRATDAEPRGCSLLAAV